MGDGDGGPNGLQNFPELVNATAGATTTVSGSFGGESGISYVLDFYSGDRYLGSFPVVGTGADEPFNAVVGTTATSETLYATATRAGTETSEFSPLVTSTSIIPPTLDSDGLVVTIADDTYGGTPTTLFDEGTTIRVDAQFEVPSPNHTVRIVWGDGSVSDSALGEISVSEFGFSATHRFVDDLPSGAAAGNFTIQAIVTDTVSGASGLATKTVTVTNVPAQFDGPLAISPSPAEEGQFTTLTGSIIDPGDADQHRLTIQWSDGSPAEVFVLPVGARTFAVPHAFRDENPGTITVTLADDDSGSAEATTTTIVTNAPPSATITGPASGLEGTTSQFTAQGSDPWRCRRVDLQMESAGGQSTSSCRRRAGVELHPDG